MILSVAEIIAKLTAAGIPLAACSTINGDRFTTVNSKFVDDAWCAYVALLNADRSADLTMHLELPSGVTRDVPRWIKGFVCRHAAFAFYGYVLDCFGKVAAAAKGNLDHDAYALGVLYYRAQPRADDRYRDGPHARIVYINHAGEVCGYEEGDGAPEPLTHSELASAFMVLMT